MINSHEHRNEGKHVKAWCKRDVNQKQSNLSKNSFKSQINIAFSQVTEQVLQDTNIQKS